MSVSIEAKTAAGTEWPTNEAGRHALPYRRPEPRYQQPRAAFSAVPVPRSTAMERRISTPYVNEAHPPPYRSTAEADEDRQETIDMVNGGRHSNSATHPEGFPSRCNSKGDLWSSPEVEAAMALLMLQGASAAPKALPTPEASKAAGASAGAKTYLPPPSTQIEPTGKRIIEGTKYKAKKANNTRDWKVGAGEPRKERATKTRPHKCQTCGRLFKRPDHLKRHLVAHAKERDEFESMVLSLSPGLCVYLRMTMGKLSVARLWFGLPPVMADGRAQVDEREADTIDSPAQPDQVAQDSEPPNA
ncbi:hypothetical protein DHEL01_v205504 [Diaporthe helianthi]|uniref:C2H2-type domain-containing protein n=1 Tax=Diaporthe helianthi TaxID=158607 RepID=A0A2P5I0P7_DIAHE|nr:hypothetical protein DHEL01_v205504 [Diaporthe helianthi]